MSMGQAQKLIKIKLENYSNPYSRLNKHLDDVVISRPKPKRKSRKLSLIYLIFQVVSAFLLLSCTKESASILLDNRAYLMDDRVVWFFDRNGIIHEDDNGYLICNMATWRVSHDTLIINFGYQDVIFEMTIEDNCIFLYSYASIPRTICPLEYENQCNLR